MVPRAEPGLVRWSESTPRVATVAAEGSACGARVRDLGEAEIEDFGVAAFGDEDVGGLDVAMNDAFGMGGIERVGDFDGEVEEAVKFHGTASDEVFQSLAFETFHGDEGLCRFLRRCRGWCRCWDG